MDRVHARGDLVSPDRAAEHRPDLRIQVDLPLGGPLRTIERAVLPDEPTGRLSIYYGAADTVTALAFAKLDEVLDFIKTTSER